MDKKKKNSLIFLGVATLVNILIFFIVFALFVLIYIYVVAPYVLSDDSLSALATPFLITTFIVSILIALAVYRLGLNAFFHRVDYEECFEHFLKFKTPSIKTQDSKDKIQKELSK